MNISLNGYFFENGESNCGWFPLFPFFTFVLRKIFDMNFSLAAFIISMLSILGTLLLQNKIIDWHNSLHESNISKKWFAPFSLLFFGSVYLPAAFPMSITLFIVNLSEYFLLKRKYLLCGIFLFVACTAYSTTFLFCCVFVMYLFNETFLHEKDNNKLPVKIFKTSVLGMLGFCFVMVIMYYFTGEMEAFFLTQEKYGHGIHPPFDTLFFMLSELQSPTHAHSQQAFMSLLFFMAFLFITFLAIKKDLLQNKLYALSYYSVSVIYFFLLLMGTGVSPLRQYLLCQNSSFILASEYVETKVKIFLILAFFMIFIMEINLFTGGG